MSKQLGLNRRQSLKILAVTSLSGIGGLAFADMPKKAIGAMVPGKGWVNASGQKGEHDGTPLQFMPKGAPDENPQEDDIKKYPRCPYCGMMRQQWNHSRHLVQYDDGLADGTCSIHCAAISLSLNLDRGPKAIYAADFGAESEVKPLINVDQASYVLGSKLPGTMSATSKMAFASKQAAEAAAKANGGDVADFDTALAEAYVGMAADTIMIRKRRGEKMKKMMKKMMEKKVGTS